MYLRWVPNQYFFIFLCFIIHFLQREYKKIVHVMSEFIWCWLSCIYTVHLYFWGGQCVQIVKYCIWTTYAVNISFVLCIYNDIQVFQEKKLWRQLFNAPAVMGKNGTFFAFISVLLKRMESSISFLFVFISCTNIANLGKKNVKWTYHSF